MFKFSNESAAGLQKLGRDIYNVTHRTRPQPETTQSQQYQQQAQPQTTQTTLPNGTPTIVNNIYNNIPPTQVFQAKKASILKAIFYASLLTVFILFLYYIFTNPGGLSHILQQGIGKLHEILTTIF